MERKLSPFAPYIMKLIEDTWLATKGSAMSASMCVSLIAQERKKLRVKTHKAPVEDSAEEEVKAPSWAQKLARRARKTFCLTQDVHDKQYKQYRDNKKIIKLNKDIARKLDLEVSPAGSEENPKSEIAWKSQYAGDLTDRKSVV